MKKITYVFFLLSFLIAIFAIFSFTHLVSAKENTPTTIYLNASDVINEDYFAAGNSVTVNGTVNGDAYVAGGNVTFDGVVNGDLLVAGGNVTILGKVTGDVRAVGGNVVFSSQVTRNATLVGGTVSLSDSGNIAGSLVSAGGNISVQSPVGKGGTFAGGQVSLDNSIGGTVTVYTSKLSLDAQTRVLGDLNYWSDKEYSINPEASISGKTNYHYTQTPKYDEKKANEIGSQNKILGLVTAGTVLFHLYCFIISFVIGLLFIKLLPVFSVKTVHTLTTRPWESLGIGFLTVLLFPLLFIILLLTLIGIPLALVLLISMILLWFIAETFVALFLGAALLGFVDRKEESPSWSLFIGLLVISFLSIIPIVNVFVGTLVYLFGIGSVLIQKKESYLLLRQKHLI